MEVSKAEVVIIEKTNNEAAEAQLKELNEVQLTLVGGGIGSVIFV